MTKIEAEKLLEETAAKIGEHFDVVQILVSWSHEGQTSSIKRGVGNWYARQGMAHEFINEDVAQDNALAIAQRLNDKPDEGDSWKAAPL